MMNTRPDESGKGAGLETRREGEAGFRVQGVVCRVERETLIEFIQSGKGAGLETRREGEPRCGVQGLGCRVEREILIKFALVDRAGDGCVYPSA